jgi:hypothetical protein
MKNSAGEAAVVSQCSRLMDVAIWDDAWETSDYPG